MANQTAKPLEFWTSFSPELRTELRNHFDPNKLGAAVESPDDATTRRKISAVATILLNDKKYKVAEELFDYYCRTREDGRQDPDALLAKYNVAYAQLEQGEFAKAETSCREFLGIETVLAGRYHMGVKSNFGMALNKQEKFAEAEIVLKDVLPVLNAEFHQSDPRVLGCMRHLMEALSGQGKLDEAKLLNDDGMVYAQMCGEPYRKDEIEEMEHMRKMTEEH